MAHRRRRRSAGGPCRGRGRLGRQADVRRLLRSARAARRMRDRRLRSAGALLHQPRLRDAARRRAQGAPIPWGRSRTTSSSRRASTRQRARLEQPRRRARASGRRRGGARGLRDGPRAGRGLQSAHLNLVELFLRAGDPKASEHLESARTLDPSNPQSSASRRTTWEVQARPLRELAPIRDRCGRAARRPASERLAPRSALLAAWARLPGARDLASRTSRSPATSRGYIAAGYVNLVNGDYSSTPTTRRCSEAQRAAAAWLPIQRRPSSTRAACSPWIPALPTVANSSSERQRPAAHDALRAADLRSARGSLICVSRSRAACSVPDPRWRHRADGVVSEPPAHGASPPRISAARPACTRRSSPVALRRAATAGRALACGMVTGVALLTSYTALLLIPIFACLALVRLAVLSGPHVPAETRRHAGGRGGVAFVWSDSATG